ncbi:MAG: hypothetical protein GX421_01120 [Caldisericales bacterium]|nr:hypothetical protein [Caldisericales bacterium]
MYWDTIKGIAEILVCLATIVYAYLTYKLIKHSERILQSNYKPMLDIDLHCDIDSYYLSCEYKSGYVLINNIGNSPALHMNIKIMNIFPKNSFGYPTNSTLTNEDRIYMRPVDSEGKAIKIDFIYENPKKFYEEYVSRNQWIDEYDEKTGQIKTHKEDIDRKGIIEKIIRNKDLWIQLRVDLRYENLLGNKSQESKSYFLMVDENLSFSQVIPQSFTNPIKIQKPGQ